VSKPGKSPAFQFYAEAWLSDFNVRSMSPAARGVYVDLLSICWLEGGIPAGKPSGFDSVSRALGLSRDEFDRMWVEIESRFYLDGDRYQHARLDSEREKQRKFRESRQLNGSKGGRPKQLDGKASTNLVVSGGKPTANLDESSLSLSLSLKDQDRRALTKWKVGNRPITAKMHAAICQQVNGAERANWDRVYAWADTVQRNQGISSNILEFCVSCAREQLREGPALPSFHEVNAKQDREWAEELARRAKASVKANMAGSR
jgi:uncharacterized protein YdaU (DUF1376 family)